MILLIDNFDSFTYNIYQYLRRMNQQVQVVRNNALTVADIEKMNPDHIIISPGPGRPEHAGISVDIVNTFKGKIPILGICLGHQCIGYALGCEIVKAGKLYHGKSSVIHHDGKGVFRDLPNPLTAIRYHSLVIRRQSISDQLQITATSEDGEIMAIRHKHFSVEGVQFHPESIGTEHGYQMLDNFLSHKPEPVIIRQAIQKVFKKEDLTEKDAEKVMNEITSGEATPAQIACFLTALTFKGESVSELTGFTRIMRQKATAIEKPQDCKVIDTCGTGGDAKGTFNISTIAAFVAAGAGVTVAKHGNRSITSRCGSADILEALGVNISIAPERITEILEKAGIAFMFAPRLHESMKHAVPVRKEIGVRTAFNILGPLTNPAKADYQIIGVYHPDLTEKVAKVLNNLGTERAMVVHGSDGLDEITLTGPTMISEICDGWLKNYRFDPAEYNFHYCTLDELKGGDLRSNCEITLGILNGDKGPKRDVVLLNAAAAIYVAKKAENFKEALRMAQTSIDEGLAMKKLDLLITLTSQ
jgi:anthranilate synthase/phosphoribosyltransferase